MNGSVTSAVREIALSEGMDPDIDPVMLYRAIVLRCECRMEEVRRDALTQFNMVCLQLNPKDRTYYDVVGHLYPEDMIKASKEKARMEQEKAKQMKALEDMRAMADYRRRFNGGQ